MGFGICFPVCAMCMGFGISFSLQLFGFPVLSQEICSNIPIKTELVNNLINESVLKFSFAGSVLGKLEGVSY